MSPSRNYPHLMVTNHMIVLNANYHLSTVQWTPTTHLLHLLLVQRILYTVHMASVHMAPVHMAPIHMAPTYMAPIHMAPVNLLCGKVAEISQYLPKTLMCQ